MINNVIKNICHRFIGDRIGKKYGIDYFLFKQVDLSIDYHHCQLFFAYPAIKQLALSRLNNTVDNYFVNSPKPEVYSISTSYRSLENCQVLYISNVAFIFSKLVNTPPLEIAKDFATFYAQTNAQQQDFTLEVVPSGFLQFKLTEFKLANWLQCLPFLPLTLANLPIPEYSCPVKNNSSLFAIQYAYARCYCLMELAQREGLITLETITANQIRSIFPDLIFSCQTSILIINQPQPMPWLNCTQQLQFCHQAEYALIIQLVKVVDDLYSSKQSTRNYSFKTALNLSQAFADFYSHCRIFGKTNAQTPKLAQVRLGLILGTYTILKVLLQRLGVFAPQQL